MILAKVQGSSAATVDRLFPRFGNKALDIPSWDAGKGMFLVDQYQSKSGNRNLTYVGICDRLVVEMTVGHSHCWEFINKVRAMICDGPSFKVVATCDWPQGTHLDMVSVREELRKKLEEYALGAAHETGLAPSQISAEVEGILSELFGQDSRILDDARSREMLSTYCESRCVCRDLTGQEDFLIV